MKKTIYTLLAASAVLVPATGCIEVIDPQTSIVTVDQAADAPNGYNNFVSALTSITGQFFYWPSQQYPYDFGYPAFYLVRDVMGSDIAYTYDNWWSTWAFCGVGLGPRYAACQMPWTVYYSWIKNCNTVIGLGEDQDQEHATGSGIAYTMRAMMYMDLARMYAQKPYSESKTDLTVPIVTESTSVSDLAHNPRATNEDMWAFILEDLDKAEALLTGYQRSNVYTPDVSVVYGLKARAYQWMGEWANAEKYAKSAQIGYTAMTGSQYNDRVTGFNTPNSSWIMGTTFKSDDPTILENDGDSSWGSAMAIEIFHAGGAGCGYAANYGQQLAIDFHLYQTIPSTDFRKLAFIDFAVDDMYDADGKPTAEAIELCSQYSDYPEELAAIPQAEAYAYGIGGLSTKFRPAGGKTGRENQYVGFVMAVPMMRVEEMMLIEAEAAGMQNESEGIRLLTEFAKTRDPQYVYGKHNEAYGNPANSAFQNEVWWQRRVELWGEGQSMFDYKRYQKCIIRSYEGTNHLDGYQWNTDNTPQWMTFCIGGTEPEYNYDLIQNPIPVAPVGNSDPYVW